jgi:hypothetical protein
MNDKEGLFMRVKSLLGLLGGGRNIDNFNRDDSFLVNRVSVGRRGRCRGVHNFFDDGDLGILMLVTASSSRSAVHENSKDPEHPDENANSATENECDGSTLPMTEIHERVVDAIDEGSFTKVMVVVAVMTMMGAVDMMRTFWMARAVTRSFHVATVVNGYEGSDSGRADGRPDHNLAISMNSMTTNLLDERQTKSLPESVGNFDCFLLESIATATSARKSHSLLPNSGN